MTGVAWLWIVAGAAFALEGAPAPPRSPRPGVGPAPWADFRPTERPVTGFVPLSGAVAPSVWEGWIRASASPGAPRPAPGPSEGGVAPPRAAASPTRASFLDRERPAFRDAWVEALAAARRDDPAGVRAALAGTEPSTPEGAQRAARLGFAAAVAAEDRAAADSIFYRISWDDAGRTAARLAAWRALVEDHGAEAARVLSALPAPTSGERAAVALARWTTDPSRPDQTLSGAEAGGVAGAALALARARSALLQGDLPAARHILAGTDSTAVPEPWRPTLASLRARSGEADSAAGGGEDATAYREAARAFAARDLRPAGELLDRWLVSFPASPYRPQAYLLRGEVRLAEGEPERAADDLTVAERSGGGETAERARLARAFLLAQRNRGGEGLSLLDAVLAGPLGRDAEPELLFDRARLARLTGDDSTAVRIRLRLEEGYPDLPWALRVESDTEASKWRAPWPVLPPEPAGARTVPAPRGGPIGALLWGEAELPRAAARLSGSAPVPASSPAPGALPPGGTAVSTPAAAPSGNWPRLFAGVAGGGPAAVLLEGAGGGRVGGLLYRGWLSRVLSSEPDHLPDLRRTDGEGALGWRGGSARLDLAGEGAWRHDDPAGGVGLIDRGVTASWKGLRGNAAYDAGGPLRGSGYVAWARGALDTTGTRDWRTDQVFFGASGGVTRGGARWSGSLDVGRLDQRQPDFEPFRYWYRNLRVARRAPQGWYVGGRVSAYHDRALVMPVAGVERGLGSGWTAWAATEPGMELPAFDRTFVRDGDWNVPDLTLPAERRDLDLRGGVRWRGFEADSAGARVEVFHAGSYRTWSRVNGVYAERALDGATGSRLIFTGGLGGGAARLSGRLAVQSIRSGGRDVPYVPRAEGQLELAVASRGWQGHVAALGAGGRKDEAGTSYGSFLRFDLGVAYRLEEGNLPFGARWVEMTIRVRNLTDQADRRWPGVPGAGIGVYGGVQALY